MKSIMFTCKSGIISVLALLLLSVLFQPALLHAQESGECWFTPTYDTVLFAAPVFTVTQQSAAIRGGESYAVKGQAPNYLLIQADTETQGYIKRDQGALSGTCGMNIPVISAPLMSHPTLCVLNTPAQPVSLFADAALQVQAGTLRENASYAVVQRTETSYYVYIDEYAGGWVPAGTGTMSGVCDTLPSEPVISVGRAVALQEARLWSAPNVYQGSVLVSLQPGSPVTILSGPVSGPISYSSNVYGDWYQVRWNTITGWIWSERLSITTGHSQPASSAITLQNTRAWSHPNVKAGYMLASIPAGMQIQIVAGPVSGPIRYDTDATGDWYQVSLNGTVLGWVWEERLSFGPG